MEDLPEVAVIIEKLNQELFDERDNYEKQINSLKKEIKALKDKYEPSNKDTVVLIHKCLRSVNHYNIAKVIHALNEGKFICISLKRKEWLHRNDEDIFVPTEGEVLIKRCIEDSIIVFHTEIRKIEDILQNHPEHPMYEYYETYTGNFVKIYKSLQSPRTKSFILRELRELYYI